MEKILAILSELKAHFTGFKETLSKLTAAEDRVKALEADLATAKQTIGTLGTQLEASKADLQKANDALTSKATEISTLTASLEKEKQRTTDTLAAMGISPDQLPASEPKGEAGANGETAWAKYNRLHNEGKHREAGEFYAANAEEIFKSRK